MLVGFWFNGCWIFPEIIYRGVVRFYFDMWEEKVVFCGEDRPSQFVFFCDWLASCFCILFLELEVSRGIEFSSGHWFVRILFFLAAADQYVCSVLDLFITFLQNLLYRFFLRIISEI